MRLNAHTHITILGLIHMQKARIPNVTYKARQTEYKKYCSRVLSRKRGLPQPAWSFGGMLSLASTSTLTATLLAGQHKFPLNMYANVNVCIMYYRRELRLASNSCYTLFSRAHTLRILRSFAVRNLPSFACAAWVTGHSVECSVWPQQLTRLHAVQFSPGPIRPSFCVEFSCAIIKHVFCVAWVCVCIYVYIHMLTRR